MSGLVLLNVLYLLVSSAIWIAVLVAGFRRLGELRGLLGRGLVVGGALLVLHLPNLVLTSLYLDFSVLGPEELREAMSAGQRIGMFAGYVLAVVGVLHCAFQLALSERWAEPRSLYPTLFGRDGGSAGWGTGALVGAAVGVASVAVFWMLDVGAGEAVRALEAAMADAEELGVVLLYGSTTLSVTAVAVSEEILFRGVVQEWVTRRLGGTSRAAAAAIVLSAALWALGHAGNTDAVGVKLAQVFVIGLIFGHLARRHSVEAAAAAHVLLNLVAVAASPLIE